MTPINAEEDGRRDCMPDPARISFIQQKHFLFLRRFHTEAPDRCVHWRVELFSWRAMLEAVKFTTPSEAMRVFNSGVRSLVRGDSSPHLTKEDT